MFRKTILSTLAVVLIATAGFSALTSGASAQKVAAAPIDQKTLAGPSPKSLGIDFTIAKASQPKLTTMQWTMVAGKVGNPILSGNRYHLFNAVMEAGLKPQNRTFSAEIGWMPKNKTDFTVRILRKAGDGQVRYGDVVALELKSYGWLRAKDQKLGISLSGDRKTPHYIWVVTGGQKGTKLVAGMPFALFSTKENAELIYCVRPFGINLGWHDKSDCDSISGIVLTKVFGENGLFSGEGLAGKGLGYLKDYICEAGVTALAASIGVGSGGTTAAIVAAAAAAGIKECREL